MTTKIWTDAELGDLIRLRDAGKTLKECAEIYGVSVSAMQRRMDRNPLDPEFRRARHAQICEPKIGYCKRCSCVYG